MPRGRFTVLLAIYLEALTSLAYGQFEELSRSPMPVSGEVSQAAWGPERRTDTARSALPSPQRVAQRGQPFLPPGQQSLSNQSVEGFQPVAPYPAAPTSDFNSLRGPDPFSPASPSTGQPNYPFGGGTTVAPPPTFPPVPGTASNSFAPPLGQAFPPAYPPYGNSFSPNSPISNSPISNSPFSNSPFSNSPFSNAGNAPPPNSAFPLTRFGIPPQGFDPGFTPEVDVADLTVNVTPSPQSLSYFAGLGFNSDQGLFGRLSYDDRDFDWTAFPWRNPPVPFRGGGQRLRLEAMPGAELQRYLISFEQPFFAWFGGRPISFHLSGHYFERDYFDWNERRAGGKVGFGYGINDVLSLNSKFSAENVDISDPRLPVTELLRSVGNHERYAGSVSLVYDTRDVPFAPSSGRYLELEFEQVFGSFDYPRGKIDYRHYMLLAQRPDRSGRHIFGLTWNGRITGSDTPIYDNLFAGGYATLRGFRFRHASPKVETVIVGGELSLTGSAEYYFPVTADDMIRGVLFSDIGTISEGTSIESDDLRVSVGGGLRVYIPALGPAPLSIDAAVPLVRADGDRVQNVHFYMNLGF